MRLAKDIEVLKWVGRDEILAITGVQPNTYYRWISDKRIGEKYRMKIALSRPHELMVDDDNIMWWINDEVTYNPPGWVPIRWWEAFIHSRKVCHQGVRDEDLERVVEELAKLKDAGCDTGHVLRYAITHGLAMPIAVKSS